MAAQEPMVVVYHARNLVNGKRYIGVTKRGLRARERGHRRDARQGAGHRLHQAIRKYGQENFVFEVLVDFMGDYEAAKIYEREMICKYKPEYNLTAGGEGGTMAASTRAKISAAHRGQKRSDTARANMSASLRLRPPPSAETREKIRAAKLGRPHSPEVVARRAASGYKPSAETRAKMAAAQTGRPPTKGRTGQPVPAETREKIRQTLKQLAWADTPARDASRARTGASAASEARKIPLRCLDDGRVFESAKAAALFYGMAQSDLGRAVREQRAIKGLRFERLPKSTL